MFHPLFQSRGENIWGRSNFQLSSLRGWEFPQARCAMSRLKNKAGCWVVLALPTSILAMPAQATSVRKANYWSLALACDRMDCSRQIMMQMGFTELGFLSATSLGFGEMLTVELGGASPHGFDVFFRSTIWSWRGANFVTQHSVRWTNALTFLARENHADFVWITSWALKHVIEGSLEVKPPTIWRNGKAEVGTVREEKSRREKIREEKEWEERRCRCAKK